MLIAIRSEVDSRILLYPLMRTLWNYGSILVITSNEQLFRLIDDRELNGFRNSTIIVEPDGAIDEITVNYGIAREDYDFIIMDNTAFTEYDLLFLLLGTKSSESFAEDVELLTVDDEDHQRVFLLQYGMEKKDSKYTKGSKDTKGSTRDKINRKDRESREAIKDDNAQNEIIEDLYDPADKFRDKIEAAKTMESRLNKYNVSFPTFQEIEMVEAEHKFYNVHSSLIKVLYDAFGSELGIDLIQFRKELRKKDEGRSYIKSTRSRTE